VPQLIITSQGKTQKLRINGVVTLGRQSNNTITLTESKSSRRHARIVPSARGYILEDLASSNGTYVNGVRITRRILKSGDEIKIGTARVVFTDQAKDDLLGSTMGNYKIPQISMNREVALKLLNPKLTRNREFIKGFVNEAHLAGQLNHPNIIHVHDSGGSSLM